MTEWTDREKRLHDALKDCVDYIIDGCPEDSYGFIMVNAKAALKDFRIAYSKPRVGNNG